MGKTTPRSQRLRDLQELRTDTHDDIRCVLHDNIDAIVRTLTPHYIVWCEFHNVVVHREPLFGGDYVGHWESGHG